MVSEERVALGRNDEYDLGHIEVGSWAGHRGLRKLTVGKTCGMTRKEKPGQNPGKHSCSRNEWQKRICKRE